MTTSGASVAAVILALAALTCPASSRPQDCHQGILPGAEACPKHYAETMKSLEQALAHSGLSADEYAELWFNCFTYRQKEEAAWIGAQVIKKNPFWGSMFEKLGGERVPAQGLLRSLRTGDMPSKKYYLIFACLFTPKELREANDPELKLIAAMIEKEMAFGYQDCFSAGAGVEGLGAITFSNLVSHQEEIMNEGLHGGCLASYINAAFTSCHYDKGIAAYERLRNIVMAISPRERGATNLGFNFAFLAYLAGKQVVQDSENTWIVADGVRMPAASAGKEMGAPGAYEAECRNLVLLCKERSGLLETLVPKQ